MFGPESLLPDRSTEEIFGPLSHGKRYDDGSFVLMARRNQKDRCCPVVRKYGLVLDLSLRTRLQVNSNHVSGDGWCLWASGCSESELDATMIGALSSLLAMTGRIIFAFWSANMVSSSSVEVFIFNLRPVHTKLQHDAL